MMVRMKETSQIGPLNVSRQASSLDQHQCFVIAVPNTCRSVLPLDYQLGRSAAVVNDVRYGANATVGVGYKLTD